MPETEDKDDLCDLPQTPQAPLELPRRTSSLNFHARNSPAKCHTRAPTDTHQPSSADLLSRPFASRQQCSLNLSRFRDAPSPGHVAQMQKVFQAARASVHRELLAASSPASSIEARLREAGNGSSTGPEVTQQVDNVRSLDQQPRNWRYSLAPNWSIGLDTDVREPLSSPTLPALPSRSVEGMSPTDEEPLSSGFCSPTRDVAISGCDVAGPVSMHSDFDALKVEDDDVTDVLLGHPAADHKDNASDNETGREIYISVSAEAAALSAKAKRKLLKGILDEQINDAIMTARESVNERVICPDPTVHDLSDLSPCFARSNAIMDADLHIRPQSTQSYRDVGQEPPIYHVPNTSRATATGSPMPFGKIRSRPSTANSHRPFQPTGGLGLPTPRTLDEHFQPGWYYSKDPVRPSVRQAYSFSTAAAKVVGSDQAPDSRIRDSYKTDTLTALAKPPSRYRKNGIGATVPTRGISRYYQRPPSSARPPSSRSRPSSRQTYSGHSDVRFRSSPPRGPQSEHYISHTRKRAMDDIYVSVDEHDGSLDKFDNEERPVSRLDVNEETRAAVRMSIFGASTPEALRKAREGIRELSPNVPLNNRTTLQAAHQRKKRRPSYWDHDLKGVKESPAGRGGVNSPVSAKTSLRAEFEIASLPTEMDLDD